MQSQDADQAGMASKRFVRLNIDEIMLPGTGTQAQEADVLLTASIARHGLLQPVVVQHVQGENHYVLLSGARRLRACKAAGLKAIDACLLCCDEAEAAACCIEETATCRQPDALFGGALLLRADEERVAERFALPRAMLAMRYRFQRLPASVRLEIVRHGLTAEQAEALLAVRDEYRQAEAASIIAQRALSAPQAKRLVYGPVREDVRGRRRRKAALVVDVISRAVEGLRARGIPLQVSIQAQDGGIGIMIVLKKEAVKSE